MYVKSVLPFVISEVAKLYVSVKKVLIILILLLRIITAFVTPKYRHVVSVDGKSYVESQTDLKTVQMVLLRTRRALLYKNVWG